MLETLCYDCYDAQSEAHHFEKVSLVLPPSDP